MKTKLMMIILAAGIGIAGCSANREGQTDSDTMMTDTSATVGDTTMADSVILADSTRQDTMRTQP